ncbi:hypothetical protein CARN8_2660016 [mine drainage metagenome]|uniref:Uncharacterized protein n=1 Tax=mine drainage metagenome TaxID=410659 RepID=A0A3P3ZN93_9ZZZZ
MASQVTSTHFYMKTALRGLPTAQMRVMSITEMVSFIAQMFAVFLSILKVTQMPVSLK